MKRYDDLTEAQKAKAVKETLRQIIRGLLDGTVQVKLPRDLHNRFLEKTLLRARATGDFEKFNHFLKISDMFKSELTKIAEYSAKNAYYTQPQEYVLYEIAE